MLFLGVEIIVEEELLENEKGNASQDCLFSLKLLTNYYYFV